MSYSTFSDAAAKSPKAQVAGNDAWSLWVAAIMYCNRHNTDGFVPLAALATECLPVPISLARAKKMGDHLCALRAPPSRHGYFEQAAGGYRVHDFLDWNQSKAQVDAKRKADRDRKRIRPDQALESDADSERIPDGRRADSDSHVRPRGRPIHPYHSEPAGRDQPETTAQDLPASPHGQPSVAAVVSQKVKCPRELTLTSDQRLTLESGMIPGWAIDVLTTELVASWVADPTDLRPIDAWRKCLSKAIAGEWNKRGARLVKPGDVASDSVNSAEGFG